MHAHAVAIYDDTRKYRALRGQAGVPIAHKTLHLQHALLYVAFYACSFSVRRTAWRSSKIKSRKV